MKIEKLNIENEKFNINLKFYFMLKHIVKTHLTDKQSFQLLEIIILNNGTNTENLISQLSIHAETFKSQVKKEALFSVIEAIETIVDVKLLSFTLKLCLIKDLLLQEAKIKEVASKNKLIKLDPLSITYDKISVYSPYTTRVNGALLSLLFFSKIEEKDLNFMSQDTCDFINELSKEAIELKAKGVEPNQIFMLMFSESINQSITSDSGSNYEDRILSILKKMGIPEQSITKTHDKNDASTEFDFFFEVDNKAYGIGAKRTLRERYKQFIKTALMSKIDVMICITLGLDLNKDKAETIRKHGVYLFVADEIYSSRLFLQKINGVYPVTQLTLDTLKNLK